LPKYNACDKPSHCEREPPLFFHFLNSPEKNDSDFGSGSGQASKALKNEAFRPVFAG
jgi:hypothetical protein